MARKEKKDSGEVDEEIIPIITCRRLEDLLEPLPIAVNVQCYKCKKNCCLTPATLQSIVRQGWKHYRIVCLQCLNKDPETIEKLEFIPFTDEQKQESKELLSRSFFPPGGAG